ncbi:SDR family oxidoreductase [Frankia sp. CNm7]|uniref:SDR family oxidoreductase n=1 Tax=Frankia nepalensis TaxID=1836974 RepID=A0A937RRP8_9ACTN|nr:SDR family oxidoreductase [Frankia nepalensis]MBL7500642.1 SDR family oxidoreductase [Frankia nepalensis]MBL7511397.1 SDR family oxidoreductase [Frankia nepalensis]MBL7521770.1 SDR family oxidoreductase [Frankia nepalensis]MBL7631493.1 SDR family oxidoreductase [Frankia nepalensis]
MVAIEGAVVLVTGGSRGLGRAFVDAAYARGAKKIYATARDPRTITHPGAVPLALEVTDPAAVTSAAGVAHDVTVLINNAGGYIGTPFLGGDVEAVRQEFETNFYGPLRLTQAFAPVIAANGGGHVLNVASVLSWFALGGSYAASKAALWSLTNSLRVELHPRGIGVTSLHVGYIDTDMAAAVDAEKADPREVAELALDGVEAGAFEVLADEITRQVKAGLAGDPAGLYPELVP